MSHTVHAHDIHCFRLHSGGKSALSHKEPTEKILAYFEEIVPEYDKERVYVSDMKKIIQWYNLLTEKGMLDLDEEAKEEEKKEA